jgi:hypothetical protein
LDFWQGKQKVIMFSNVTASVGQALITAQVYGILLLHARIIKKPITYSEIGLALKLPRQWGSLTAALNDIAYDDYKCGRPLLSSLVVSCRTKLPGQGYWDLVAHQQGLPQMTNPQLQQLFWDDQFNRLTTSY